MYIYCVKSNNVLKIFIKFGCVCPCVNMTMFWSLFRDLTEPTFAEKEVKEETPRE